MKAAIVTRYGGPSVLRLKDVPAPAPGPGEVVVKVHAIGLNFADLFGRMGVYPGSPKPPFIPGLEFSGLISDVGTNVTQFSGGERVLGYSRWGSHAEYVCVSEHSVLPLPEGMSFDEGAAFLATGLTAYHGLVRLANTAPGETILVHAAAGGVGLAVLQLGRALRARMIGTVGHDAKIDVALSHGADRVINYRRKDFAEEIRQACAEGVDVVMDGVGGRVFSVSWDLLAPMGRYVLYGVAAVTGQRGLNRLKAAGVLMRMKTVLPSALVSANKAIFGFNLGTLRGKEDYLRAAALELLSLYTRGLMKPIIGMRFRFDEIIAAHEYLQTRRSTGKVVVRVVEGGP